MVREGYSQITVSDATKERFHALQPDDATQDEYVAMLLDIAEEKWDEETENRIPDDQYADLVDDVAAVVERRLEQVMR